MPLRALYELHLPETIGGFETAAEERYWDGIEMLTSPGPHRAAGIYLIGYAAEMLLKTASFRFNGSTPADASSVYDDVSWIRAHHTSLWS